MLLGCVLSFVDLCHYCLSYVFFMLILFGSVYINVHVIFIIMPLFSFVSLLCQFLLMFMFFCMILLCKYMCCGVYSYFYFTNLFVFLRLQKIAKKRKFVANAIYCVISRFGTNQPMFVSMSFSSMLDKLFVCSLNKYIVC